VYDRPDLPAFEIGEDGKKRYSGRRVVEVVLRESEAELIRDAAVRVLRGESLRSIADEWNDAGVMKVKGGRWTGGAVSQLLESPHLAALVHWKGEVFDAEWPAVLDRETHERLVKFLHHPGRKNATPGSGKRKHLLAGLVYCGGCGGRLVAAVEIPGRRSRTYMGRRDLNPECPGRVRIDAESLEEFVVGHVVDLWTSPRAQRAALADDNRHDQLVALADRITGFKEDLKEAYDDMRVHKIIDRDQYLSAKKSIDAKIKSAEQERDELQAQAGLADLPDPSAGWEKLTAAERRLLLEMLTPRVVIGPHPKGESMRPFADTAKETARKARVLDKRVGFE
jgi:site-specific DNA recombinase